LAYGLLVLVALLVPFDFHGALSLRPDIELVPGQGVVLKAVAGLRAEGDLEPFFETLTAGDGLTVEAWVEAADPRQRGPARIVSYSLDAAHRNFTLGQQEDHLVMRLRTDTTDLNGKPSLQVPGVFDGGGVRHVAITYDGEILSAFVDGEARASSRERRGDFSSWDRTHSLVLGNEADGTRPWRGRMLLVAVYARALGAAEVGANHAAGHGPDAAGRTGEGLVVLYRFDEADGGRVASRGGSAQATGLRMLDGVRITGQRLLAASAAATTAIDLLLNVVLFVPWGFLAFPWTSSRLGTLSATIVVVAAGGTLSLAAETLQYFSISRTSALTDVAANGLGALLGVALARHRPGR
jgi:hypothetical protein